MLSIRDISTLAALGLVLAVLPLRAQERGEREGPGGSALNLGIANTGLSIGNSHRWNGVRINFIDRHVDIVNGLNLTFWYPRDEENAGSLYHGLSLGVVPTGGTFRGITIGGGVVAHDEAVGITVGLLGAVANGTMRGINLAGLGLVANRDAFGLNVGGLGTVANGDMYGVNLAGLGLVANRDMMGINVAGLGTVANRDMTGISIAGLGTVANGDLTGVSVSGIGTVANGRLEGIALSGIAVVGTGGIEGIALGGVAVVGASRPVTGFAAALGEVRADRSRMTGWAVAGYRVRAEAFQGLANVVGWTKIGDLTGASIGGVNYIYGEQRGLTIGIFNYARELHGVQLGLLNYAGNNEGIWRLTPIVNVHLK
ncbi:MAG: hypothetical protein PVF27_03320 [Gemmatimonadales bacterium]